MAQPPVYPPGTWRYHDPRGIPWLNMELEQQNLNFDASMQRLDRIERLSANPKPVRAAPKPAENQDPAPTFNDPQPTAQVHIKIPDEATPESFTVFKNFLCHYSDYFEAAFNGRFKEGETQEVTLDEIEPELFGIFLNWTYTQKLHKRDGKTIPSQPILLDLWLLADRFLAPKLQNEVICTFESQRVCGKGLGIECYDMVYEDTVDDSRLRKYLVGVWDGRKIDAANTNLPFGFLADVLNAGGMKGKLARSDRNRGKVDYYSGRVMDSDLSPYLVDEIMVSKKRRQGPANVEAECSSSRTGTEAGKSFAGTCLPITGTLRSD